MRRVLYGGLLFLLSTAVAWADQFAGYYGNTLHVRHADGATSTFYFNPDKTWEQHQAGATVRGTYFWKDPTHVCIKITDPPPPSDVNTEECDEITGNHRSGETWTVRDAKGTNATFNLTTGRQ